MVKDNTVDLFVKNEVLVTNNGISTKRNGPAFTYLKEKDVPSECNAITDGQFLKYLQQRPTNLNNFTFAYQIWIDLLPKCMRNISLKNITLL